MFKSKIGQTVLLVDDSRMDLASMTSQLRTAGCVVNTTDSHNSALKLLKQDQEISVVILDHGIICGSVADFISAAKTIRPTLFIVGSSSSDCRREFAEGGADCFLRKPWLLAELTDVLKSRAPSNSGGSDRTVRRNTQNKKASSATRVGNSESDTMCLSFSLGEHVRIAVGKMEGLDGTVSGPRSGGKILVRLTDGIFVEVHQYVLERIDCSQTHTNVADSYRIDVRGR